MGLASCWAGASVSLRKREESLLGSRVLGLLWSEAQAGAAPPLPQAVKPVPPWCSQPTPVLTTGTQGFTEQGTGRAEGQGAEVWVPEPRPWQPQSPRAPVPSPVPACRLCAKESLQAQGGPCAQGRVTGTSTGENLKLSK